MIKVIYINTTWYPKQAKHETRYSSGEEIQKSYTENKNVSSFVEGCRKGDNYKTRNIQSRLIVTEENKII